jgi:hypothetical protein
MQSWKFIKLIVLKIEIPRPLTNQNGDFFQGRMGVDEGNSAYILDKLYNQTPTQCCTFLVNKNDPLGLCV